MWVAPSPLLTPGVPAHTVITTVTCLLTKNMASGLASFPTSLSGRVKDAQEVSGRGERRGTDGRRAQTHPRR